MNFREPAIPDIKNDFLYVVFLLFSLGNFIYIYILNIDIILVNKEQKSTKQNNRIKAE